MRILVTGGAGFIGSNLVDKLLIDGHEIACVDNFDKFYSRTIKEKNIENALRNSNFHLKEVNITRYEELEKVFSDVKPELVIHLAAKAGVRPSIVDPAGYYQVNVIGTLNVLEAMKKNNVKKMLFASSSSVYGNNLKVPFSESDPVDNPISPYAATKKSGELLCHTYHYLYNFDIYCLRFFTVYGPRQRPDLAIHKFTNKILQGEEIDIFGDGSSSRDYTYIDDIVGGLMSCIDKLKGFEVINLGESQTITLKEMLSLLEESLQIKAKTRTLPMQQGDVNRTFADISKAKALLNYAPKWDVKSGILEFVKWKL